MPYIYLVHCRASVNANENVYKIGKSIDFNKRLSGYDKGTIPIFTIYVKECDDFEKILIKLFETKFSHRKDYGNEYFYGNVGEMIQTIMNEYEKYDLCYSIENKKEDISENIITIKPNIIEDNTIALIKTKKLLINKLNKIKITEIYDFINNITINSQEYNYSTYYSSLQNYYQQFTLDTQTQSNKLKYGDYLENKCRFISNICHSAYCGNDIIALKLIERIKICV